MPLYKRRIKQSFLSQSSQAAEEPQVKSTRISSKLHQSNGSQTAIDDILQINKNLRSPTYPEALPRTASEPNESAFVVCEGFNESEASHTIIGNHCKDSKIKKINISSHEQYDELFPDGKNCETIVLDSSDTEENKLITENTKEVIHKKNENIPEDIDKTLSNPKKNSKLHNDAKTKSNESLKQSYSSKPNINELGPSQSQIKYQNVTVESSENLNASHNYSINSQESNLPDRQHTDVLNSSNESSKDFGIKNVDNNLPINEKKKRSKNDITLSQRSDISMSDPAVKNAYIQFMKKKEKFHRVATPIGLKHDQKMRWLQQQRNVGVYVHCDKCDKIRYLDDVKDPLLLPEKWYCKNNSDILHNNCGVPQEKFPVQIQEDWIDNLYNAGSLVWARVEGYPWWPGIVDDDPNTECYYWLDDEFNNTPSYYHVTFFDEKEVTRAWLKPDAIKPFMKEIHNPHYRPVKFSLFKKRIDIAIKQAEEADKMSLLTRLEKFSFVARYKKPIIKPRDVTLDVRRKSKKTDLVLETMNEKSNKISKKKDKRTVEENKIDKKKNIKKRKMTKSADTYDPSELFCDFEIPSSPVIEDISLDLFEDI